MALCDFIAYKATLRLYNIISSIGFYILIVLVYNYLIMDKGDNYLAGLHNMLMLIIVDMSNF